MKGDQNSNLNRYGNKLTPILEPLRVEEVTAAVVEAEELELEAEPADGAELLQSCQGNWNS